jgi:hypothetical protein
LKEASFLAQSSKLFLSPVLRNPKKALETKNCKKNTFEGLEDQLFHQN